MVMGYRAWNGPSSADAHSRQAQPRGGGGNDRHASRQDVGRRAGPDACAGTGLTLTGAGGRNYPRRDRPRTDTRAFTAARGAARWRRLNIMRPAVDRVRTAA